jgi:hypothetical protein
MIAPRRKTVVLSALLMMGGAVLMASVMSGGFLNLVKSLIASGAGHSNLSGGTLTLSHSVGQPNAGAMIGGNFELVSGYQAGPLGVLAPQPSTGTIPAAAVVCGIPLGVSTNAVVTASRRRCP